VAWVLVRGSSAREEAAAAECSSLLRASVQAMRRLESVLLPFAVLALASCAATIREEAGRAEQTLPPQLIRRLLGRGWTQLDQGKRIFDIRLSDRRRVLSGEGALSYETRPVRLRLDVFGPHATPVFSLIQVDDSMAVRLYDERRFVSGPVGDPAFARLTEGRTFTGQELLGALLGAYDVPALLGSGGEAGGGSDTLGYDAGDEWVVFLIEPGRAHRFGYSKADSSLMTYRQDRGDRPAYDVRFSDYRPVEGRPRPFRIQLEDVPERRTIRVNVRTESFQPGAPPGGYRLEPF
jgi:hypothetical protein